MLGAASPTLAASSAMYRIRSPVGASSYMLCALVLAFGSFVAASMLVLLRMPIVVESIVPPLIVLAFLVFAHFGYRIGRPGSRLGLAAGGLAVLTASLIIGGIISHAGLCFHMPLVDDRLLAFDHGLGIRTERLVRFAAAHPISTDRLAFLYSNTVLTVILVMLGLAGFRRVEEMWDLCLGFSAGVVLAAMISIFTPAVGVIAHEHLERLDGLPHGAGTYFLAAFHAFRDGHMTRMDIRWLNGVVEFPSFHTVMALIVPYAVRRHPISFSCAMIWAALVIVSTIPIGGHYLADLIGGALLWAGVMAARRVWGSAVPGPGDFILPPPRLAHR